MKKFIPLVDLGIVVVPPGYLHNTQLATFSINNTEKLFHYDVAITDNNFLNPTNILKEGKSLRVYVFCQLAPGTTTSKEHIEFLAEQKALLVGAQGASLVFEQKHSQLPKGYWYGSLDEKNRLWEETDIHHGVPGVAADSRGDFSVFCKNFEGPWHCNDAFLVFYSIE